jgi:hypothetical protein
MEGDERVRYCGLCRKSVYNLSGMTPGEAADLIRRTEGNLCVRLLRRRDGTLLTEDCPVGVRRRRNGWWLLVRAALATIPPLIAAVLWFGRSDSAKTRAFLGAPDRPDRTTQPDPDDPNEDGDWVVGRTVDPQRVPPQPDEDRRP